MTTHDCQVLVIGSGPGGATTAALLAEAGHDVLLVEEGADLSVDSAPNYSLAEMDQKYRNGGLNTTFGKTPITYIEGRCVGGASEINAALYHRPHEETLDRWARDFQIDDFGLDRLRPRFEEIERELHVGRRADGLAPSSRKLIAGADKLGWRHGQIQRFWRYDGQGPRGRRQSMSETMVPRARSAGARLLADTRVVRLITRGSRSVAAHALHKGRDRVRIRFDHVVVAAGAVQTPLLLLRSRIHHNIGNDLRLHPMIRIAAQFPDRANDPAFGVPVQQVEEFKPGLTLGCSHSSLPHIALWMGRDVPDRRQIMAEWERIGVFYVAVQGEGHGKVRSLALLDQPLIQYQLSDQDMRRMGQGLEHLGELLFAAGAQRLFSPVQGRKPLTRPDELPILRDLPHGSRIAVSSIHLFSSAPMGEDHSRCAVDSYGRLRGYDNIRVHDASILPTSPGVNPQGTIMAIVRRNTAQMLAAGL
ncbi:MAG: GMC family oxidoreductase [Oligoflexia bacterium]|nr:GMC family oxidoreductase [Oligoflexia bacterium]